MAAGKAPAVAKKLTSLMAQRALAAVNYWIDNIPQEETDSTEFLDMVDLQKYLGD